MDKLKPGFHTANLEHDKEEGWHMAYVYVADLDDTVRVVMSDGTFIDVTCKEGLVMVRCTDGTLVVYPDTANQIGIGQSTFYPTLADVGLDKPAENEDGECPEGEARFFPTADDLGKS